MASRNHGFAGAALDTIKRHPLAASALGFVGGTVVTLKFGTFRHFLSARVGSQNPFVARHRDGEKAVDNASSTGGIVAGSYTLETLAEVSPIAKRLSDRIDARRNPKALAEPQTKGAKLAHHVTMDDEGIEFPEASDEGVTVPIREE